MCWVALDRGIRLSEKRSLPAPNRNKWYETRDKLYEEIQNKSFNKELGYFGHVGRLFMHKRTETLTTSTRVSQSYEHNDILDAAVLIMPLCFFISANDPRFVSTLTQIMRSRDRGGLTENALVYRYDTSKVDDGTGGGEEGAFSMVTLVCCRTSDDRQRRC